MVLISDEIRRDSHELLRVLEIERVERLFLPFVALDALAVASGGRWPTRLRDVVTAGEQLRITPALSACFGNGSCRLHNHYGPTETHVATAYTLPDDLRTWPELPLIGRPIANTRIYVLDSQGQPVPVGVAGEIHIGGAGVARGYLNRPDLTAEQFLSDPFAAEPGARMYRTGDLGRWLPDGDIDFLGRADFQVKIRGFRIELGEIESVLRQNPAVREAVVLAREDVPGDRRLVAYVTGDPVAAEDLRRQLAQVLPDYMVPAAFVGLDALPLTPNGKLDRKALPAPDGAAYAARAYEPPHGELETKLAALWAELLGIERVGRHDHFFELGGHSLLAVRLQINIRERFASDLPLAEIFQFPTVTGLAARLETRPQSELTPLVPRGKSHGPALPLSFAQEALWMVEQILPLPEVYHIPKAFRLSGALEVPALETALRAIVARHEVLRTRLAEKDGVPRQFVATEAAMGLDFLVQDVRHFPEGCREPEARRRLRVEAARPFDLTTGPLLRVALFHLGDRDAILGLTLSHLIADGWSLSVFARELSRAYSGARSGRAPAWENLPIQYADFCLWQRATLRDDVLQKEIDFWKQRLAGLEPLELPTDRPRPAQFSYRGGVLRFTAPEPLVNSLRCLAQDHRASLFMVLLATFQVLLSRYSGQTDFATGTPVAGRSKPELENLIGLFANIVVLRADLSGEPSFSELLERVRATFLEALAHSEAPFEKLVQALNPPRDLSRNALFQVAFLFEGVPEAPLVLDGAETESLAIATDTAKFDLTMELAEAEGGLRGTIEYATDLFGRERMQRMAGHFLTLLEAVAATPDTPVWRLPLLSETERLELQDWNRTTTDYPAEQSLVSLFEAKAAGSPARTAVIFGEEGVTFGELSDRANRLAHVLIEQYGIGPGAHVGLLVERSVEMVVALLAILKAGGAYVPLDPDYAEKQRSAAKRVDRDVFHAPRKDEGRAGRRRVAR